MAGNPAGFPRRKEKEEEMSNILVVDSSWLMHRSKHTIGDILSHNDMKTGVMFGFFWSIFKFCKEYKTSKLIFCFDSKENLRKSCYTGYKSSRNSSDKTEFERLMDDAAYDQFNLIPKLLQQLGFRHLYRRRGYESDDLIASICMSNPKFKDSLLVLTNDNDLLQLLPYCKGLVTAKGFIDAKGFQEQYGIKAEDWTLVKAYAGCFDEETEILTENGWKYFKDLVHEDRVLTMDPKTQNSFYCPISKIIAYKYEGDMFRIEGFGIDALVTPNHKFFGNTTQSYNKPRSLPTFKEIEKIINYKNFTIPLVVNNFEGAHPRVIKVPAVTREFTVKGLPRIQKLEGFEIKSEIFMAFLGIYLSDGFVTKNRNGYAGIIGICKTKPKKVKVIRRILNNLGVHYNYVGGQFIIHSGPLAEFLAPLGNVYHKHIPLYIKGMDKTLLKILVHYLILCDGHTDIKKVKPFGGVESLSVRKAFYTVSKTLADDLQEIILKCGEYAAVKTNPEKVYTIRGKSGISKVSYVVRVLKSKTTNLLRKNIHCVPFSGMVYDVTVEPHHTILVRRNGIAYWSSNCTTDSVPGIPGFGVSTAIKFIKSPPMKGVLSQRFFSDEGRKIIERNKKLTTLPYEGTPKIVISGKDSLNWDAFLDMCSMYALETFLGNPKNFEFWKTFFLNGGWK